MQLDSHHGRLDRCNLALVVGLELDPRRACRPAATPLVNTSGFDADVVDEQPVSAGWQCGRQLRTAMTASAANARAHASATHLRRNQTFGPHAGARMCRDRRRPAPYSLRMLCLLLSPGRYHAPSRKTTPTEKVKSW